MRWVEGMSVQDLQLRWRKPLHPLLSDVSILCQHTLSAHNNLKPTPLPPHPKVLPCFHRSHLEIELVRVPQQLSNRDLAQPRARAQKVPHTPGQLVLINANFCCCCCCTCARVCCCTAVCWGSLLQGWQQVVGLRCCDTADTQFGYDCHPMASARGTTRRQCRWCQRASAAAVLGCVQYTYIPGEVTKVPARQRRHGVLASGDTQCFAVGT
jgi:hypothetical protein